MSPPHRPSVGNDIFAHRGRQIISHFLNERVDGTAPGIPIPASATRAAPAKTSHADNIAKAQSIFSSTFRKEMQADSKAKPVGILGAGATGLYTALILQDLGIPYKIIEGRDRVGGRLYTHTFSNQTGAPYNYFDVGAMRFPEISSMARVFHLFDYAPLNTGDLQLKKKLCPFYFSCEDAFLSYNGVTVRQCDGQPTDSFQAKTVILDTNPEPYIAAGAKTIADDVIEPFATRLLDDLTNNTTTGWEYMRLFDGYSTRSYMNLQYRPGHVNIPNKSLSVDTINWVETFDKSTGWYDRALTETVLEAVAFGWNPSKDPIHETKWWCIDGGAFQIADVMYRYLQSKKADFSFSKRVTDIKTVKDANGNATGVEVTTDNYDKHEFSHVISSIPLPVLRTIDLTEAALTPMQSNAIRQLNYGPSIKIGMQFRTAWWTNGKDLNGRTLNIVGGQSYTDSPLRTVVYPSFGDVKGCKTTTLIASYCWTEDSERLAALIANDKKVLEEMVLRELGRIHNVAIEFLRGQLIDTYAWSWSLDPFAMGAFAFFGPGKFDNVYTSLTNPAAGGRLHFAGEALSTRHAWVEGALDSAWRAVHELLLNPDYTSYQKKFFTNWGINAEWFAAPQQTRGPAGGKPKSAPILVVPGGKFEVPKEKDDFDVDALLQSSLLVQHIAVTHPELVDEYGA